MVGREGARTNNVFYTCSLIDYNVEDGTQTSGPTYPEASTPRWRQTTPTALPWPCMPGPTRASPTSPCYPVTLTGEFAK